MQEMYYVHNVKNLILGVLNIFDGMTVTKYTSSGVSADSKPVPIQFGPIGKDYMKRTEGEYFDKDGVEHNQRFYLTLPRMALTVDSFTYDQNRCYGANEYRFFLESNGVNVGDDVLTDYSPAPWSIGMSLNILSDSTDYFFQIWENVLPYFNPKSFIRVKEFPFLNIERDIPISITNTTIDFPTEMQAEDKKYFNGTIGLNVEAFMYRQISYSKVIKFIHSKYYIGDNITNMVSAVSLSSNTPVSATGLITEAFNTSGVGITSASVFYPTSAVPPSGTYYTSGTYPDPFVYNANSKNYGWWSSQSATY
jgi:hypothetical protein